LYALLDVMLSVIERLQSKSPDFYRELDNIFVLKLALHNSYCGFKALRERWKGHLASSRLWLVLLIDEPQEIRPDVLSELRILCNADLDATLLLTVILSEDSRLLELLRHEDLVLLGTRVCIRLMTEATLYKELLELLQHALQNAGNVWLITAEFMKMVVDHSVGNYRLLMLLGLELLA
jgi:hypothetical protein